MPTQIDSAGITFNDATSLTSANIGTAQLVNGSVIASKLGTNEQKQICKAWVNFNGTTSPGTIRSSYNVSSVTKNGTGEYTVNFATPMSDANYAVSGVVSNPLALGQIWDGSRTKTISSYSFFTTYVSDLTGGGIGRDTAQVNVSVFGN